MQILLKINFPKLSKAIIKSSHFYMLIKGRNIDNNAKKIYE